MGGSFDGYLSRAPQRRAEGSSGAAAPHTFEMSQPDVLMLRLLGNGAATRLLQESLPARATTLGDFRPGGMREHVVRYAMREHVSRTPLDRASRASDVAPPIVHDVLESPGEPLPVRFRQQMSAQFGHDFAQVRVHADSKAAESAESVDAAAYTVGEHVVLGQSTARPSTLQGQAVLAHELAHVVQQPAVTIHGVLPISSPGDPAEREASDAALQPSNRTPRRRVAKPMVQRVVSITAPKRGATAVAQIPDFVDRLNRVSHGLAWARIGENLAYAPKPGVAALDDFDRRMQAFVDRPDAVPLRMITRHGLSSDIGAPPGLGPVTIDQLQEGYVDVDDLLASDDDSFRLNLIHFIVERFAVPDYARRIGTDMSAILPTAHRAGLRAERDHLRERLGDPTLGMPIESNPPGGGLRFSFPGDGYVVRHDFKPQAGGLLDPGTVTVRSEGQTFGLEEFIAHRERERYARQVRQSLGGGGPHIPGGPLIGP